jgi:hypothetical protein
MILVQLIDEPPIGRRGGTAGPDELEGLRGVKAMSGDEVTAHNGNGAASTHRTMNEHACVGTRAQSARDVPRCAREVRRKLREGRVVQGNLRRVRGHRRWERYVARHRGQYVSDSQRRKQGRVLRSLEIRDVQPRKDLRDVIVIVVWRRRRGRGVWSDGTGGAARRMRGVRAGSLWL